MPTRTIALIKSVCKCTLIPSQHTILTNTDTYNANYEDGSTAHGGYANYIRAHEYFTFKIPDAIPSHEAAPLLCAGITTCP